MSAPTLPLRLPAGRPVDYIAWMAFWREIEHVMQTHPALERLASRESAPFLRSPTARFLSDLVPAIRRQALKAHREGQRFVSPSVTVPRDQLADVYQHLKRRSEWLNQPGVVKRLGVHPLGDTAGRLRRQALLALMVQIHGVLDGVGEPDAKRKTRSAHGPSSAQRS